MIDVPDSTGIRLDPYLHSPLTIYERSLRVRESIMSGGKEKNVPSVPAGGTVALHKLVGGGVIEVNARHSMSFHRFKYNIDLCC